MYTQLFASIPFIKLGASGHLTYLNAHLQQAPIRQPKVGSIVLLPTRLSRDGIILKNKSAFFRAPTTVEVLANLCWLICPLVETVNRKVTLRAGVIVNTVMNEVTVVTVLTDGRSSK